MSEGSNGHVLAKMPSHADEASDLVASMLARFLAEAKTGRWKFAAVVLCDGNGGIETDFKGAVCCLSDGNFGADIVKSNMIIEKLRLAQQPSPLIVRARASDLPQEVR